MLRAICRSALSIDRAAPSRDLLLAQASTDGATIDGLRCAIDGLGGIAVIGVRNFGSLRHTNHFSCTLCANVRCHFHRKLLFLEISTIIYHYFTTVKHTG